MEMTTLAEVIMRGDRLKVGPHARDKGLVIFR